MIETEAPVDSAVASSEDRVDVAISNRERIIFPESKITKGELADYYAAVADIMLPTAQRIGMSATAPNW